MKRILAILLLAWAGTGGARAADDTVRVPGAWPDGAAPAGQAWLRAWLKPAPSFFSKHERNLFAESVVINLRGVADAHEVFVNGTRVGTGGAFAPDFRSGRDATHRHKIPPGLLERERWNEITLRVYHAPDSAAGLAEAPFVMNYFDECVLEGEWEFHAGDAPAGWPGGVRAERPARAAFELFHESHRVLGEAEELVRGPSRSPAETLAAMHPAPGLAVDLLLAEPLVAQPTHLSFDERGRLWITHYRQYPYPAGVKPVSRDKYYRTQYDRVPPAPPRHDRGRDVVSIHEDTNGDGAYDRHRIFQDGLNMANAALRGRGGVWVMHTPYLLFYPDADFDDVPDGPPVTHLAGFGLEDSHSVANGLVWGLDGWLYGAQGSTTSSRVRRPGLDAPDAPGVFFEGCMVWRYHPETRAYEIFAEGGGNTFGLELDDEGRLFSGHNGGGTRGWHFVQGGIYSKQGYEPGKIGPPHRPYSFGELPMLHTTNPVVRFTHHFAVVGGTAFAAEWQGRVLAVDPLHSLLTASVRAPRGATFATTDLSPALRCDDEAFRPVFAVNAPDGSVFVADYYDHYIAHGQHYQGQLDPDTGRVFRLRGEGRPLELDLNLAGKTSAELVALLDHPNRWHRHTAVRLLGDRRDPAVIPALRERLARADGPAPLGAFCSLFRAGALDEASLHAALAHPQSAVRTWAVRLAGEGGTPGGESLRMIERLASVEPNAEVCAQIASSARRWPVASRLPLLRALAQRTEFAADPFIPHLLWWAVEDACAREPGPVLYDILASWDWEAPLTRDHLLSRLMRRAADRGTREDLLACARLLRGARNEVQRDRLMEGFEAAFQSRSLASAPDELVEALIAANRLSLSLRLRRHDPAALPEALRLAADAKAAAGARVAVIACLGELAVTNALPVLLEVALGAGDDSVRTAALRALGGYSDASAGARLVKGWPAMSPALRRTAAGVLATRTPWSRELLDAVERATVPASDIPAEIRGTLAASTDPGLAAQAARVFPANPVASPGAADRIARVEAALRAGTGNPYAGETVFTARCASCHRLFQKGGNLGPDLTRYQRDHLATLLTSVLDPGAEIREGYQFMTLRARDGRVVAGFLVEQDARRVVLRGLDGADLALARDAVGSLEPVGRSLMPEGLLDDLDEQGLRDLFAFLRSAQPISK